MCRPIGRASLPVSAYPRPKSSPPHTVRLIVLNVEAFGFHMWSIPNSEDERTSARTIALLGPKRQKFSPSAMFVSW